MNNRIEKYGFKIKIYKNLKFTDIQDKKYGYSREFKIDDITTITFNIIPNDQPKWICEKVTFNSNIFNEISNHEILNKEDFLKSGMSEFNYSMQELGYTINSYRKASRWAYVESKEEALEEIVFQYSYLFKK